MSDRKSTQGSLDRFARERNAILEEVVDRVARDAIQRAWDSPEHGLEYLLNEAAFFEIGRLEDHEDSRNSSEYAFWRDIAHRVGRASEEENAELLRNIVTRYAREIAGHFRAGVSHFARSVLPASVSLLYGPNSVREALSMRPKFDALRDRIRVEGEVGKLRMLADHGTIVIVPTHSSHIDSLTLGWGLYASGLPPVLYGAGKNLFNNPITSFFLSNLGAYRVDRRIRHTIYKNVLKEYSNVLLERGFHAMFFPGGGRSRSNEIEKHLKLGLLGTALRSYTANVMAERPNPNIFVVPVTINYNVVLESETLVDEFLRRDPHKHYIIDVDEFSDLRRVSHYVRSVLELDSAATLRFGTPMDVFGNEVDQDGESLDACGRRVDPRRYLWVGGKPRADRERDMEYTRELGERVVESFHENNVVYPIHLASFALFEHVRRQHPAWDLYRTLRFAKDDAIMMPVAEGETERLLRLVRRASDEGRFRLAPELASGSAREILDRALRALRAYHADPVADLVGGAIRLRNLKLLFYYGNRLRGYELEARLRTPGGY
jgi:glycerol-3-phosphate O-acyltransferase